MLRRQFLQFGTTALCVGSGPRQKPDSVVASASRDQTARVSIVTSDFTGARDHDGTEVKGLADPQPVSKDLTHAQMDGMLRKSLELDNGRHGGLAGLVEATDWVVIKPNIVACHGLGPETRDGGFHHRYIPGTVADLRLVHSLISFLVEHKCGARITVAEGSGEWLPVERSKSATDGWTTDWGAAFGGLTYRQMIAEFSKKHRSIQFEIVDLNFDDTVEMPAPANPGRSYHVPKTIQQCDKLISVAPMKTHALTGVSLSIKNYFGIGPGARYGFPKQKLHQLGPPEDIAVDLFSFHPADYAIVGGSWGVEGDGPFSPGGESVHHNVIVAGANAVAVDAVGAAVMGFEPSAIKTLRAAERKGFGGWDTDTVWVRGSDLEQARRPFRKPRGYSLGA